MATKQDDPVDRDAWRRLLEGDDDAPSALTDARIRAAARRALVPRAQRWWLPASLAASLLLAVLVVQWQYGDRGTPPVVTESDVAAPAPAESAPYTLDVPSQEQPAPPPAAPRLDLPDFDKRSREEPAEEDLSSAAVTARKRESAPTAAAPPDSAAAPAAANDAAQEARAKQETGFGSGLRRSAEPLRSPEDWYALIEDLRKAGRDEEADRELDRLEAAYPGWLEKNHPRHH